MRWQELQTRGAWHVSESGGVWTKSCGSGPICLIQVHLRQQKASEKGFFFFFKKWIYLERNTLLRTEKAMAPYSSTLAWKIPWTEEPGRLQSMGSLRVGHQRHHFHFSLSCIGEGNGNPLQCSYLVNPRDGGAWWAAVYGVAQSRTRLKRLSSSSSTLLRQSMGRIRRWEWPEGLFKQRWLK